MAQEFPINSSTIESKINQLLPSQGGKGAGIDFSASTMVIPIVDLTESAEGSSLRLDLQTAMDFATDFNFVSNATATLVATTGFYRVFGVSVRGNVASGSNIIFLDDGSTQKTIYSDRHANNSVSIAPNSTQFDFITFLSAGISLKATSSSNVMNLSVSTRQIADISGNLVNPLNFT
jgi:hypothetical protein